MKYQLWSQDEYGTGVILGSFTDPNEAMKKASALVTDANFGNSLSSSEQMSNIEAYLVEVLGAKGEVNGNYFYTSNRPDGKHRVISASTGKLEIINEEDTTVRIYIGSRFAVNSVKTAENKTERVKTETRVYLKDHKGKEVSSLSNELLKGKTIYFIRQV